MKPLKVVLIGPMGAGKTTLGSILSNRLGWPYFDNDAELESLSGLSSSELSTLSVPELHKLEGEYLSTVLQRNAPFISGAAVSVVGYQKSVELLKESVSIYLRLPLEKLLERAGTTGIGRQALIGNAESVISARFSRRDPLYREIAVFTVELGDDPDVDAEKIFAFLSSI